LYNVEVIKNCPTFPLSKKDKTLSGKIGSIDFETYGESSGLGVHQVYAGG